MPWRWCTASSTSWKTSRTLDIRQLLDELSHQIAGGMSNDKVQVEVDVPSRVVSGSVAVALALFTVEVLTNIFKHAFPDGREGVIRVTMQPIGDGKLKPGHRR